MKKLLVLALLLVAGIAFGQVTYYRTDAPLAWDAVTQTEVWIDIDNDGAGDTDINGDAIVELISSVEYEVGRSVDPVIDRTMPDVILAQTPLITYLDDPVPADGNAYVYAIRTRYTTASGWTLSPWNWADENGAATPNPFLWVNPDSIFSREPPMDFRRQ